MRKKILDTAAMYGWIMILLISASSNIPETGELPQQEKGEIILSQAETSNSSHSFTPESDEKTSIEKNNVILVTSAYYSSSKAEEVKTEENVEQEVQNRWNIRLTTEEIDLLAKIVWVESRGEPVQGQEAVVEVVFNRMASTIYPDTLYDVLSQKHPVQFCSWKYKDTAEPTEREYDSIYNVLSGNTRLLRNDTMYFSTFPLTDNIEIKIGDHYFCY